MSRYSTLLRGGCSVIAVLAILPAEGAHAQVAPRRPPAIISPAPAPAPAADEATAETPAPSKTPAAPQIRRAPPVITAPASQAADESPAPIRRQLPAAAAPAPTATTTRPTPAQPIRPTMTPVLPGPGDQPSLPPTVIVPPSDGQAPGLAGSLTLRPGGHGDLMRNLRVVRQISGEQLRANPTIRIGTMQADFRPVLNNPRALPNIAQKLRGLSSLVEVRSDLLEAAEVEQGLLIRSVLTYGFKPGACSDAGKRAQIAASGVRCFTQDNELASGAALENPRSPRFVADPGKRAQAVRDLRARSGEISREMAADVASFRTRLRDPAQRAALAAELGEGEVARLAGLNDGALTNELVNSAETKVEQVAYVPRADTAQGRTPKAPGAAAKTASGDFSRDFDIDTHIFLTGFTLGKDYEWKQRVETTIKWCAIACKKTYYGELSAGFNYGFGLRFPIRVGGSFNFSRTAGVDKGVLTAKVETIDGSVTDYRDAGLADDKLFSGKELVAQFSARAGIGAKLPIIGKVGPLGITIGKDFTEGLPAPFTNGQFRPPQPGEAGLSGPIIFDQFDLLGGSGNFGVIGGQIFPAVDVGLVSKSLSLSLRDKVSGVSRPLNAGVNTVELAIAPSDRAANFVIENPKYNVAFKVTPGLNARLFIDLALWGAHWDWPVWFPQLTVELPPGGLDFACHEGTTCSRDYRYTEKGAQSELMALFEIWGESFDTRWVPKCGDDPCKFAIRLVRQAAIFKGKYREEADPKVTFAQMGDILEAANSKAGEVIAISDAKKTSSAMGKLAIGIWTKQCKDILCYDNIVALANEMGPRAGYIQTANPAQSPQSVNQQVNAEFVPKFQKEVDDSKRRADMEAAAEMARQAKRMKQLQPPQLQLPPIR